MLERMRGVKGHYPKIDILKIEHDENYIHMLVSILSKMSEGRFVGILKMNTSRWLKEKFNFLKEVYWGTDSI